MVKMFETLSTPIFLNEFWRALKLWIYSCSCLAPNLTCFRRVLPRTHNIKWQVGSPQSEFVNSKIRLATPWWQTNSISVNIEWFYNDKMWDNNRVCAIVVIVAVHLVYSEQFERRLEHFEINDVFVLQSRVPLYLTHVWRPLKHCSYL